MKKITAALISLALVVMGLAAQARDVGPGNALIHLDAAGLGLQKVVGSDYSGNTTSGMSIEITSIGGEDLLAAGSGLSLGDPILQTGSLTYGWLGDVAGSGVIGSVAASSSVIGGTQNLLDTGAVLYAKDPGDGVRRVVTTSLMVDGFDLNSQGLDTNGNIVGVAGVQTDYVDNGSYRAQAVGIAGNGNNRYGDVAAVGGTSDIDNGVVTIANGYDGFGNPIGSVYSSDFGYNLLLNHGTGYSNAEDDLVDMFSTIPGQWYSAVDNPVDNYGLVTVTSLDAVGGVAVDPTLGIGSNLLAVNGVGIDSYLLGTGDATLPVYLTFDDGSGNALQVNDSQPLPIASTTWGGVALAQAVDIQDIWDNGFDSSPNPVPVVGSQTMAFYADQSYSWPVTGTFLSSPAYDQYDPDNVFTQDVRTYSGVAATTDTYTANDNGTEHIFPGENYTWQIRSDDPASIGLAVTAKLQISIDNGASWATLDTKTVANITDAPTTISAKPGMIFRVNITNLVLGATATNVSASVLAK